MRRDAILSGNTRQYINVKDVELLKYIEQILPYYTSFNKLLNDALRYGLPLLLEEKTGKEITLVEEPKAMRGSQNATMMKYDGTTLDTRIDEGIRLLSEIAMTTTLNKFMLCGLYNAKVNDLEPKATIVERLKKGIYNRMPNCLFETEMEMLKKLPKRKEDK